MKKILIGISVVVIVLLILFTPIPRGTYDDGGTREYIALTYRIVDWNKISNNGIYEKTRIYFGSDYFKTIDELWELEMEGENTGNWRPDVAYKPVIYLYPEQEMEISVNLTLDGKLTCTYPLYNNGWNVIANPDGTLTDFNGQTYNYLYWEGETYAQWDMSQGFCVKGQDTATFLEDALENLGLTRREANELIVYWLPLMQENPYNIISFQTDVYTESAKLEITPNPDTLIRVFMVYQPSDKYVEMEEQKLTAPERNGFTVVEWGGTEIR